jgi:hypothetical protein
MQNMEKNLQNNASEMTKVKMRFPNESNFEDVVIDMKHFEPVNHFNDEVFGWYKGTYISLKK